MEALQERQSAKSALAAYRIRLLILLMIFTFGGIFGFVYEELFYRIDLGYFVKRGNTYGPWITIYGFGAVLIALSTEKLKSRPLLVALVAALVCGILEFATGYVLYHVLGLRLWDYNTEIWNWLNINGFVCLRSVLFFGASALLLQYVVEPMFQTFAERCSPKVVILTATIPAALFGLDSIINLLNWFIG